MRLLLLSNSTNFGGTFLGHAGDWLREHLTGARTVAFIPFAAVRFSYDEFVRKVAERFTPLGCDVQGVHAAQDPVAAVRNAGAIAVGGGNTFQLLARMYELKLLDAIRERGEARRLHHRHFTDAVIPNHGGETRSERLLEFLELNPGMPVLGMREGTAVRVDGQAATLLGDQPARAFLKGREPWDVAPGPLIDFPPRDLR